MVSKVETGSRIRDRRIGLDLKQADLAAQIGISASYLNLIEHNRRRIGGKLLLRIAESLGVAPQTLTEGAEASVLADLHMAAQAAGLSAKDMDQADAMAERFPAWAQVIAHDQQRIAQLEHAVGSLQDRMTHDPYLGDAMHELLTTAAAVRSTAEILAQTKSLEPEWQQRFQSNIDEDSRRLAEGAQALVSYLDLDVKVPGIGAAPQEEADAFFAAHGPYFEALEENPSDATVTEITESATLLRSDAARISARTVLSQMKQDARIMSLKDLKTQMSDDIPDPVALARRFGVSVAVVLRRLAALPDLRAGLIIADRSGAVIFRKPIDGFSAPRFGACCPLWPLFEVLGHPGMVVRQSFVQLGRAATGFDAIATAEAQEAARYNTPPLVHAIMLLLPAKPGAEMRPREVGVACPTCAKQNCVARRVPSMLGS